MLELLVFVVCAALGVFLGRIGEEFIPLNTKKHRLRMAITRRLRLVKEGKL